jgi:hypothetical protein
MYTKTKNSFFIGGRTFQYTIHARMSRKKVELHDAATYKTLFGTKSAMQVTDSSLMEMTVASEAEIISQEIEKLIGKKPHILECSAGVGGNTVNFMKAGFQCTAIEYDSATYECLIDNVATAAREFGCDPAAVIHGDCYAKLKKLAAHATHAALDCIFADPPWGGADYKKTDALELFYGDHSIEEIANLATRICPYFVLKCPMNIVPTYLDPQLMGYAAAHQLIFASHKGRPVYQVIYYSQEPIAPYMRAEFVREPFNYRQIKYHGGGDQLYSFAAIVLILVVYVVYSAINVLYEKNMLVSNAYLWQYAIFPHQIPNITT